MTARNHRLESLFHPKSVAIVGASASDGGGNGFLTNIKELGFEGPIYPINPKAKEILGLPVYPSLRDVPGPVDHVIVAVPREHVHRVLLDCIAIGTKNVHVFTAGFHETWDEAGTNMELEMEKIARENGLNLIGPNCMGLYVPEAKIAFSDHMSTEKGPVGFISQSGGNASDFTTRALAFGIRFSKVISFGNGLVLDSTDFLEYFAEDNETKFIGMYLEGVKDGRKFLDLVKKINRTKPVVIWKGGLTESGARAVASHTGSMAGSEAIWNAMFKQTGAIRVNDIDEFVDVMQALLYLPKPAGRRVAVIGAGGGASVSTADACAREGLTVPHFTEKTMKFLSEFVPLAGTSVRNPVDAGILMRDTALLEKSMNAIAADANIDSLIVNQPLDWTLRSFGRQQMNSMLDYVTEFAKNEDPKKPILVAVRSSGLHEAVEIERLKVQERLTRAGVPVYYSQSRASHALSKVVQYYEYLERTK